MLSEIHIKNMILIDDLKMQFDAGLNVITGETGAGKSILVDCIELLMGERLNADLTRSESGNSMVEGVFDIAHAPITNFIENDEISSESGDAQIIISREVNRQGRTINRINGKLANVHQIKDLAEQLVDIHLQNDQQQVLNPRNHIVYLDSLSAKIRDNKSSLADAYRSWKEITDEIEDLGRQEQRRSSDLEYLEFQISEIETANLTEHEDEQLQDERKRIVNLEKTLSIVNQVENSISGESGSVLNSLAHSINILKNSEDPFLKDVMEELQQAFYSIEDIDQRLSRFRDGLEVEPDRLDEIEDRLQKINRVKRKYGGEIGTVLAHLEELRADRQLLAQIEFRINELREKEQLLKRQYTEMAGQFTEWRREAAMILEARLQKELEELSMPGVRFVIDISPVAPYVNGQDEVVFLFSANPGEALRPLNKIASGGEMSRFVLALKTALADVYQVPILIFDEIDAGVGGQALLAMGAKISALAQSHQVILVTHSPQIASMADTHWHLSKTAAGNITRIIARHLNREERIEELSRMLAGDKVTTAAREHAMQMLGIET